MNSYPINSIGWLIDIDVFWASVGNVIKIKPRIVLSNAGDSTTRNALWRNGE